VYEGSRSLHFSRLKHFRRFATRYEKLNKTSKLSSPLHARGRTCSNMSIQTQSNCRPLCHLTHSDGDVLVAVSRGFVCPASYARSIRCSSQRENAVCPQLTLGTERVWGLQLPDQQGCTNRTERRNLAKQFHRMMLAALGQQGASRLLTHRLQQIQLLIEPFGPETNSGFRDIV